MPCCCLRAAVMRLGLVALMCACALCISCACGAIVHILCLVLYLYLTFPQATNTTFIYFALTLSQQTQRRLRSILRRRTAIQIQVQKDGHPNRPWEEIIRQETKEISSQIHSQNNRYQEGQGGPETAPYFVIYPITNCVATV